MAILQEYTWIIALISVALCVSSFSNGANDVANSYATSVAARTLTMKQVGFLAAITEFVGAVALGSRVTDTIKDDVIQSEKFEKHPGVYMLAMACAEFASAIWLFSATKMGFTVSATQTVVGALVGIGVVAGCGVNIKWSKGSISQIVAGWGISPLISGLISALIMFVLQRTILHRTDPLKQGMRAMPWIITASAVVLAFFIAFEAPVAGSHTSFDKKRFLIIFLSSGAVAGILSWLFFWPYINRRLRKEDRRIRFSHIILGPYFLFTKKERPWIFWPRSEDGPLVRNYNGQNENARRSADNAAAEAGASSVDPSRSGHEAKTPPVELGSMSGAEQSQPLANSSSIRENNVNPTGINRTTGRIATASSLDSPRTGSPLQEHQSTEQAQKPDPAEKFLSPTRNLPLYHPSRIWSFTKYFLLQGVTRDCVTHVSNELAGTHAWTRRYDNRVEHLFTYAQVLSAMLMSIAHGSNDISNAVGPWTGAYNTWKTGVVNNGGHSPIWALAAAGSLLGVGFWFMGYHIIRAMGNKITLMSPCRGYAAEMGAAITVLIASALGLPVSTTQCVTGSVIGVALMNKTPKVVNWRQVGHIFLGWVFTMPVAGTIAGGLFAMAVNAPHF